MLYRKEANSRDRKSNIEKEGGGSIVEIRKKICLKYSNMTKCLNTFVAHCRFTLEEIFPDSPILEHSDSKAFSLKGYSDS